MTRSAVVSVPCGTLAPEGTGRVDADLVVAVARVRAVCTLVPILVTMDTEPASGRIAHTTCHWVTPGSTRATGALVGTVYSPVVRVTC